MKKRWLKLAAVPVALSLVAAACGDDDEEGSGSETEETTEEGTEGTTGDTGDTETTEGGGEGSGETVADGRIECSNQYEGEEVSLFSSIRDIEAERLETAYVAFEECTGADLSHEGSGEFEVQANVRIDGGNPDDILIIPQPGLLRDLARAGSVVELPADQLEAISADFIDGWDDLGTVDGKFYGSAFGANVKSLVWYNPTLFSEAGYEIPTTQEELLALSDQIVADGGTPWCVGIESGEATGWVVTDWIEDYMLRINGAEVYDQWVAHEIPFDDPQVLEAAEAAGAILKNEDYILGGVQSMAVTAFQEGGLGILDGSCYLHRQANFYANNFPEGTTLGPDGDVNTFYFPVMAEGDPKVMLGGGELNAATNDRPVVLDAIRFLSSSDYANARAAQSSWISANKKMDTSVIPDDLTRGFADLLLSSDVFRFDGSDMMPGAVGAGTFWSNAVSWIVGDSTTEEMLSAIEASWPA